MNIESKKEINKIPSNNFKIIYNFLESSAATLEINLASRLTL
jgi:hypothetical protein